MGFWINDQDEWDDLVWDAETAFDREQRRREKEEREEFLRQKEIEKKEAKKKTEPEEEPYNDGYYDRPFSLKAVFDPILEAPMKAEDNIIFDDEDLPF